MSEIRNIVSDFIEEYDPYRSPATVVEELIKKLEVVLLKAKETGKREMLDLLDRRSHIGPSDYQDMLDELDGKGSKYDDE